MPRKELLVALLPKIEALDRLKTERWYHIPKETALKRWPPEVMAFYQGKVFGIEERYKIRYFGKVGTIDIVPRKVLFPDDEENKEKEEKPYYRVQLKTLQERETPIVSYRPRRLVPCFIRNPTIISLGQRATIRLGVKPHETAQVYCPTGQQRETEFASDRR